MKSFKHIAVEGPIGVGKTSLAKIIARELDSRLVLEEPEKNPFLSDFYKDKEKWALHTQMTFLLLRHRQLTELNQANLFYTDVVSDYIFEKDSIFARLTLSDREFKIYEKILDQIKVDILAPDLVVYLISNPAKLLMNIRIRDIKYERAIETEYLDALCEAYNKLFLHWDKTPVLYVRAADIDFVHNERHKRKLLDEIMGITKGKRIFNPEG